MPHKLQCVYLHNVHHQACDTHPWCMRCITDANFTEVGKQKAPCKVCVITNAHSTQNAHPSAYDLARMTAYVGV